MERPRRGQIITFYSYKGGTGRTMAVANIGALLARNVPPRGGRVLLIDWDLEAPGLDPYFENFRDDFRAQPGLLDCFESLRTSLQSVPDAHRHLGSQRNSVEELVNIDRYIVQDVFPNLDIMAAGSLSDYRIRAASFNWASFWKTYPEAIHGFREVLESRYDVVLIDSRTGYGDMNFLCTAVLPEKLVTVFCLNLQSLYGTIDIVDRSVKFRLDSDDIRPLTVFPLAARVDDGEHEQKRVWLQRFEDAFEERFRRIYQDPSCRLDRYFRECFIPYSAYYSYGEKLAIFDESRANSIRRAYEYFAEKLIDLAYPWESEQAASERRAEEQADADRQASRESDVDRE